MSKPRIALVISSTRATRFADKPAAWVLAEAAKRDDFTLETLDLRDFDLPMFDAPASNAWMPSTDPKVVAFQEAVAAFDGYIFLVAEYNHSVTGVLKNAFDQASVVWAKKPMAAVGYGTVGAARAVEHLRNIAVEAEMAPVRAAVHISGSDFFKVHPLGSNAEMDEIAPVIAGSMTSVFDDISWWASVLKPAREDAAAKAA